MSSDYWEAWRLGGDAYGRKTRAELEQLRVSQARSRNHLAEQMRNQQGNLQAQIDRLTEALVAFVEYEDTRGELGEHVDSAACRIYAREVVANVVVTGGSGASAITAPSTVVDYWLPWAIRGLVAEVSGADGSDDLIQADQCDAHRTGLLLVLLDAIRREARLGSTRLDVTLPDADDVTQVQRAVWVAVAQGRLDDEAQRSLETRLRGLLGAPEPAALMEWVNGLTSQVRDESAPARAARNLTALRDLLDPPTATVGTAPGAEDPLAEIVRSLVDEGAPKETEIRTRMAEVRGRMGFALNDVAPTGMDDPTGTVLDLLLADLAPSADPGLRGLALRLLGPALVPVVAQLRSDAGQLPGDRVLQVSGVSVKLNAGGEVVSSDWRDQVEKGFRRANPVSTSLRWLAYAALGVGVLGLLLAIVGPGWLVLAVLGIGGGVWALVYHRGLVRQNDALLARRLERAAQDIEHAAGVQLDHRSQVTSAAAEATETARRLTVLLEAAAPG